MKRILLLTFFASVLFADFPYEKGEGSFDPWYAGSLLSTAGHIVEPGFYNIQPFVFVTTNYANYQDNYSLKSSPNLTSISPLFFGQIGLTSFMDTAFTVQSFTKTRKGAWSTFIGDTTLGLGFQAYRSKRGDPVPFIRITISEIFPTGKYDDLDPRKLGTDDTGSGSFRTIFGFNAQKTYYWNVQHPVRFRFNAKLSIPSKVSVSGFHHYGGDRETKGKIFPGYNILLLFSPEITLTQKWVITTDLIYNHQFKGSFKGREGMPGINKVPSSDSFTMTPSFEYNFTDSLGLVCGAWLTIFGRNTTAFASGVVTVTYTF